MVDACPEPHIVSCSKSKSSIIMSFFLFRSLYRNKMNAMQEFCVRNANSF
jgi:hypothetical protein